MSGAGRVTRGQSALERLRFGASRTLNLREGLPTGTEAARRAEQWLRAKQVEAPGEVLIITGRGANSIDGVAVVRESVARTLRMLRRKGVISAFRDHTPGAFVVSVAPLRTLFEAPARRRLQPVGNRGGPAGGVTGLGAATLARLRTLAGRALESLGVRIPTATMIDAESQRQFSLLAKSVPPGEPPEEWLRTAVERALAEYDDA
ncbi:MAG TPA: hypothetical protein VLE53_06685 [Gemmatimonadaceae bacterium]|nr:hypothetical protein [Gemmatimonadaceae bacterium]